MNVPLKPEQWTPDQWARFWMHFPVGVACSLLLEFKPLHGVLLTVWFIMYELFNEWGKADKSYKDIIGGAVGFGVTSLIILTVWTWQRLGG